MALAYSKHIVFNTINKNLQKVLLTSLGSSHAFFISVKSSTDSSVPNSRLSQALKVYLKKAKEYDKFINEQLKEYEIGKKHLANIMGKKEKDLNEGEISEAISYLFPSSLYYPSARPVMKHPKLIFTKEREIEFDSSGKPYHFLFYTTKPNFTQILHEAAKLMDEINEYERKINIAGADTPEKTLVKGFWISKEDLEKRVSEKLFTIDYDKFIEVLEALQNHPYGYLAEKFIMQYKKKLLDEDDDNIPEPTVTEDGSLVVNILLNKRKSAIADVKVTFPGQGKILINGQGIDYFSTIQAREQILFPLNFTEMLNKVDIEATVNESGESAQAGAIRLGISKALKNFVPTEMQLKMKVAGLLQKDYRRPERKKPGKEGPRRSYTWLKR